MTELSVCLAAWVRFLDGVIVSAQKEARHIAAKIVSSRWGRLGNHVKRHPWCVAFRTEKFVPVFYVRVVKKWKLKTD